VTKKKARRETGFEDLLGEAEAAVEKLESGELSLEESMAEYERGVQNLNACAQLLKAAEEKVEQLIEAREGELRLEPFDAGEWDENDDEEDEDDEA